jgi:hypothetical protein
MKRGSEVTGGARRGFEFTQATSLSANSSESFRDSGNRPDDGLLDVVLYHHDKIHQNGRNVFAAIRHERGAPNDLPSCQCDAIYSCVSRT